MKVIVIYHHAIYNLHYCNVEEARRNPNAVNNGFNNDNKQTKANPRKPKKLRNSNSEQNSETRTQN